MIPRPLPPPTLETLYPPARGYRYFEAAAAWPFASGDGGASARNRWWMAEHALLAYDDARGIETRLAALGYAVQTVDHAASGTFAYAAWAPDHGVLAFRGTEAMTPGDALPKLKDVARDWLTDARVKRAAFDDLGRVHGGFAAALATVWNEIEPLLPRAPRWWCTGHSLGGALAALASARIARRGTALAGAITFGQPRCGDATFVRFLGTLPLTRVVNACDLVPRLPPKALGYEHAGTLVHLDAERFARYGASLGQHLIDLPRNLRHGVGALTPLDLIDHAPLHYAIKCYNAALPPA